MRPTDFLNLAIEQSKESVKNGGFPAGAILVKNDEIVATGVSVGNILHDPTSHGEVATIREACQKLDVTDLSGCVLYTSLEPCSMCLSAAIWASIPKVIYACSKTAVPDDFYGGKYDTREINSKFTKPLEIIHEQSHQGAAFEVIQKWQENL